VKLTRQISFAVLAAVFALCLCTARPSFAQAGNDSAASQPAASQPAKQEGSSEAAIEKYRHSSTVQAIARMAHVNVETAAEIFEDFNSAVLIIAILAFLLKVLPKTFRKRAETLQKQLFDARLATAQANERLAIVEERLSKLDNEIEAVRQQAERDSIEDEKRIRQALETERQRIIASAEQEIEAAGANARRDLKHFAAELAIDRATQSIQLTADADRILVHSFGEGLAGDRKGERN
jgi:F-type H+-transporting ATPase subunit b